MGKLVVALLATAAALMILFHLVGGHALGQTAVTVPGTEHTGAFPITWTLVVGGVLAFAIWRTVKGK